MDGQGVTFRVKDYRVNGPGRHTAMTLKTGEFIRRFLIPVQPKGQHRIRPYGFFGNGNRTADIARIRDLLGAATSDQGHAHDGTAGEADALARVLALPCPCCGGRLIIIGTIPQERQPRAPPGTARAAA
ncbi:transposase [Leisingera methylohalidivorans DSM 14336]|uniref:Transposase n=1 Tax=Leisingera methylohalidivorans DSM 14336 TaxID=999552 RepID=V9VQE8_9RHOB|nr:transposase [Leisingera methylohalidivorans DSM 14336]